MLNYITRPHMSDYLATYLKYVARFASEQAMKPVTATVPHSAALFEIAVHESKRDVAKASEFFMKEGFDGADVTAELLYELASYVLQRGFSNFADIEQFAKQFQEGRISLPEFVLSVQCSKLQVHFLQQFIGLPPAVFEKLKLSDWDSAVAEVQRAANIDAI